MLRLGVGELSSLIDITIWLVYYSGRVRLYNQLWYTNIMDRIRLHYLKGYTIISAYNFKTYLL
jgi:hypothetical protein